MLRITKLSVCALKPKFFTSIMSIDTRELFSVIGKYKMLRVLLAYILLS